MYVIRYKDLKSAIDPSRRLVKLADPNLWKPAWPEGSEDWRPGHEIRCESMGISLFTGGTQEELHYHESTWELYQTLEGALRIAVKRFREDSWRTTILNPLDMILLAPGTLHLVDSSCMHATLVVQTPPAVSDKKRVEDPAEIEAAFAALQT